MPASERRRREPKGPLAPRLLLGTIVIVAFVAMFSPLVVVVGASLTGGDTITFPPQGLSLQYYITAMQRPDFVSAFFVSIWVGIGSSTFAMLIGVPAAIGIVRYRFPGRTLVMTILMSPIMVPALVIGIILLNWYSLVLGLASSIPLLIAGHLVITLPYVLRLATASLTGFDVKIEMAARGLGAGSLRAFFSVTMPNVMPGLVGAYVFAFIRSFDDVSVSLFLSAKGVQTLPVLIFTYLTQTYDPLILAVAAFMIVLVLVLMLVLDRVVGVAQVAMTSNAGGNRSPVATATP